MSIIKKTLLIFSIILLTSCSIKINNSINNTSSSSLESENNKESFSSSSSSSLLQNEPSKEYKKDENGFFILEDDYFEVEKKNDNKKINKIRSGDINENYEYKDLRLYALGKQIPLYKVKVNTSQYWDGEAPQRKDNAVCIVELEGNVQFTLQTNFYISNNVHIRPSNKNIDFKIDQKRRTIKFNISQLGQYTIELKSNITLHLFVNKINQYDKYKNDSQYIYFGPGIYNKYNCKYINNDNLFEVNSNTKIFIDLGAILECGFVSYKKSNISIVGNGVVSGSNFSRSVKNNTRLIPYDFSYCSNINFEGITTLDPAGWTYNIYFCDQVNIDNIKIISSRSNGDGVSLQSSKNVYCNNSFIRTWDDSLVVKNYPKWENLSLLGETRNIYFKNNVIWTDLAQSLEIGYETYGEVMENINFEDIIILHNYHKAPISIHNGNNAKINKIRYKNITIEDSTCKGDGNNYLIDFSCEFSPTWSLGHGETSLGSINDVILDNILYMDGTNNHIQILGSIDTRDKYKDSFHYITSITFKNVSIKGLILNENNFDINKRYTRDINFVSSSSSPKGACLNDIKYIEDEYGNNYNFEILK